MTAADRIGDARPDPATLGPEVSHQTGAAKIALIVPWAVLFLAANAAIGHVLSGPLVRLLARLGHPELLLVVDSGLLADESLREARVRERLGVTVPAVARADGHVVRPRGRRPSSAPATASSACPSRSRPSSRRCARGRAVLTPRGHAVAIVRGPTTCSPGRGGGLP